MATTDPDVNQPPRDLDVTVVIPAHNEELAVADEVRAVHAALRPTKYRYEIIVVDDGSTDRTAELAAACECRLIRLPRNMGYGAALKHGIARAHTDLIVITDADSTYPAEMIPKLIAAAADHDMVVGARTGANVQHSKMRAPAKWFLRKLGSFLSGTEIPDLNSGLRVLRRHHVKAYARILPSGFSFTTTITLALLCTERSVLFVPVDYRIRKGTSKIRPKHAYLFLILILRVIVLFNPLKVFLPLGAFCFVTGLAKFIYDITLENLSETAIMGFIAALIIWAVGLLADQNSRFNLDRWDTEEPVRE
jgi:glycosyltransferase involved in cell wall biosynthesis